MLLLKHGVRSADVRHVQVLLNGLTLVAPKLITDGIFGGKTYAAVIAFQRQNRLVADGIVGPNTGRALLRTLSSRI